MAPSLWTFRFLFKHQEIIIYFSDSNNLIKKEILQDIGYSDKMCLLHLNLECHKQEVISSTEELIRSRVSDVCLMMALLINQISYLRVKWMLTVWHFSDDSTLHSFYVTSWYICTCSFLSCKDRRKVVVYWLGNLRKLTDKLTYTKWWL